MICSMIAARIRSSAVVASPRMMGDLRTGNGLRPGQCIAGGLGKALRKFRNGAGPKGDQRIGRVRGVALEIAAQGSRWRPQRPKRSSGRAKWSRPMAA